MSSLPVAARPAATLPRLPLGLVALVVALAVGIGVAVGANAFATTRQAPAVTTSQVKHHSAIPPGALAAKTSPIVRYRQIVANLAAAMQRHDFAAQYLLGRQLDAVLTPAVIGAVYTERSKLAASLEASVERHDTHSRSLIIRRLAELCGPAPVKSRLDFCN